MMMAPTSEPSPSPSDDRAGRKVAITRNDIYQSYTPFQRQMILISGAMVAMLTPFCDTVYLPALDDVASDLNTTAVLTSLTVSAYLGAVGVGQLVWGPLSDYYGRLPILFLSLLIFEAFTIACIFPKDINTLIALRTIEGFIVGNCIVSVQAIISDVFAPEVRGAALSYFLGPMLIGPIIAPLIGGILAETFTWRGDFVLLAVMTLPITLFAYIFTPETHHWYVIKKRSDLIIQQKDDRRLGGAPVQTPGETSEQTSQQTNEQTLEAAGERPVDHAKGNLILEEEEEQVYESDVISFELSMSGSVVDLDECESISIPISMSSDTCHSSNSGNQSSNSGNNSSNSGRDEDNQNNSRSIEYKDKDSIEEVSDVTAPSLMMPWTVAAFMFDPELAAYYAAVGMTFACMFTSLTLLPIYLAVAPYNLAAGIVGVTFLPVGVAMLLAALIGGALSDWASVKYSSSPHGIMLFNLILSLACPFGSIGFGFSLQGGQPLSAVLITQCILGFGQAIIMPSTLAFLSTVRPDMAGAAGSTMLFLCFALAAISISVSTIVADIIGVGYYFLIISGMAFVAQFFSLAICVNKMFYSKPRDTAESL